MTLKYRHGVIDESSYLQSTEVKAPGATFRSLKL